MTGEQVLIVALALATATIALLAALGVARTLGRAGAGLQGASERLDARAAALPEQLGSARQTLDALDAHAERALWTLNNFDERVDRSLVDLRSKRLASDTLRLRMIEGRLTIARLRELVRLMIRLSEIRRAFL